MERRTWDREVYEKKAQEMLEKREVRLCCLRGAGALVMHVGIDGVLICSHKKIFYASRRAGHRVVRVLDCGSAGGSMLCSYAGVSKRHRLLDSY